MRHCVFGQVVPQVLKEHGALIFWSQEVQEGTGSSWPCRWRQYKTNNTASHPRTLPSSAAQLWESQMSASNWCCLITAHIAHNKKLVLTTDRANMACVIFQNVQPTNRISMPHIRTLWHKQVFPFSIHLIMLIIQHSAAAYCTHPDSRCG